jgi:hypothetical protein
VIARLHRFYGPAPNPTGSWLDVPEWLFSAYDRAQPRLEAEETQMLVRALVGGTGHMSQEDFAAFQRELARTALGTPDQQRQRHKPATAEEMRALVRSMGLGGSFKVEIDA